MIYGLFIFCIALDFCLLVTAIGRSSGCLEEASDV